MHHIMHMHAHMLPLPARMSLINNQLTQRGFLLGSCVVCDNDQEEGDFHLSVGLSPTLITKLACSCNLPLVPHNIYDAKQRLFLAQEALKIIDRCGIKYKSHCLLHRRHDLHEVVSSRSIADINSYFGGSIAIFFTWLKFLTVSLTFPSYLGLFVFLYQLYSGIDDDWYTPLFFCCVIFWNIVFVKMWRQHVSISKFSWGQNDQIMSVDEPPTTASKSRAAVEKCSGSNSSSSSSAGKEGQVVTATRLFVYWMGGSLLCCFFLMSVLLSIVGYLHITKIPENLSEYAILTVAKMVETLTFNFFTFDNNYLGLLLYCAYSIIVEKIGRFFICPIFVKALFGKRSIAQWKMAAVYVDVAYTLIARFSILLYLCFWEHQMSQARALLALRLIVDQLDILYSARLQKVKLHSFQIPNSAKHQKHDAKNLHNNEVLAPIAPKKVGGMRKLFREISTEFDAVAEAEVSVPSTTTAGGTKKAVIP
jgi:hypothetical protein